MVSGDIMDGDHRRRVWSALAVMFGSTMTITIMNTNAASVEAGGVDGGVDAQNGGSSMFGDASGVIMLCADRSS